MSTNSDHDSAAAVASRGGGHNDRELVAALEQYLELGATGQAPDLETFISGHPEIAAQLRECLAGLELVRRAAPDVAQSAATLTASMLDVAPISEPLGDYRIVREVGRGGMGVVYEAEQLSLGRRVALKLLPLAAVLDPRHLQRFKNEALAAAQLDHPNIVEVYGVGCERGVHFFAMKFIEGCSLADVVEAGKQRQEPAEATLSSATSDASRSTQQCSLPPSTSPKLQALVGTAASGVSAERFRHVAELGIQAAEALEHAHQSGVVHRDVKPSNILLDGQGKLWITDFGLARMTADTPCTMTGDLVGTLRYMSPEQASGKSAHVDARSDVYSLGATLYELVTGRPVVRGIERALILREIAETDPTPPRKHTPSMPADLETILLKCLAKEPSARYDTAKALADDLRRFLEQKPVLARRPSSWDELSRAVRKHKTVVAVAGCLFATLVAGIVGTTWGMLRARSAESDAKLHKSVAEEDREDALQQQAIAQEQAAIATAVNAFLREDLLAQANPALNPRDQQITVEELVERAAARIDGKFAGQPRVEAAIRNSIATAFFTLQNYPKAQQQWERALPIARKYRGEEQVDLVETMAGLIEAYRVQGKFAEAEPLAEEFYELCRKSLGENHPNTVAALNALATVYFTMGRPAEARQFFETALEATRQDLGAEDPGTLTQMNNLALAYQAMGDFAAAKKLSSEALQIMLRTLGEDNPDTLTMMCNLGAICKDLGEYEESERHFKKSLEVRRRVLGNESMDTIVSLNNLATLYQAQDRNAEAELLLKQAVDLLRRVAGTDHPSLAYSLNNLAILYDSQEKHDESNSLKRESWEIMKRVHGPDSLAAAEVGALLADGLLDSGQFVEAEQLLRQAIPVYEREIPDDWARCYANSLLGAALLGQQRFAEAEPLLLDGYQSLKQREESIPAQHKDTLIMAGRRVVELYSAHEKPDEATKWQSDVLQFENKYLPTNP